MDADHGATDGQDPVVDQEALLREIASLRTYLIFVAGTFAGRSAIPGRSASDLVHSVLVGALDKIRRGDFTFRSDKALRSWLVKRLRWTYRRWKKRTRTYASILQGLRPR